MKISIFGLGYVGAVSLACLARDGHEVTGVDIDASKLDLIKNGKSPIVEAGIVELVKQVVDSDRVSVTPDVAQAIARTELSFVCVGTPSQPNGSQSLHALQRVCEQIGTALADKAAPHTIVIRSTIQPGTTAAMVIPAIEKASGKRVGKDFAVCFQPEFLREGTSIRDYDNPPMTVIGVDDARAAAQLRSLFGALPCKFIETDFRTAETLKYACNTFHALKIGFANEIGRICQAIGSDSVRVMQLLCEDTQLNISKAYLRPGFAFGGSCLPKDLRALLYIAKQHDVQVPVMSGLLPSNRAQVEHAASMILARGSRNIGVIGLSFKSGTDDLRESPLVDLVEFLIGKGMNLKIFDAEVQISRLIGANKKYIAETVPHIGSLMCDSVEAAMQNAAVVVLGRSGNTVYDEVYRCSAPGQLLIDLVGLPEPKRLAGEYRGICW
jgi:GDP-mannose 6-dehydrogenase